MAVDVIMKIRLDKFLADMGFGTRSQVRQQIAGGNVTVNGLPARRPELKVDTDKDRVLFCGTEAAYAQYEYYMLNKPAGVVSATEDKKERTVLDLLQERKRKDLFPVGRLDKDTEGLLLITNNGDLAHRLLAPGRHVDKVYYVEVDGILDQQDVEAVSQGIVLRDGYQCLPGKLELLEGNTSAYITIREGKYHQIKRMMAARGKPISYLKRIRFGPLQLDPQLDKGGWRALTQEELQELFRQ